MLQITSGHYSHEIKLVSLATQVQLANHSSILLVVQIWVLVDEGCNLSKRQPSGHAKREPENKIPKKEFNIYAIRRSSVSSLHRLIILKTAL